MCCLMKKVLEAQTFISANEFFTETIRYQQVSNNMTQMSQK